MSRKSDRKSEYMVTVMVPHAYYVQANSEKEAEQKAIDNWADKVISVINVRTM